MACAIFGDRFAFYLCVGLVLARGSDRVLAQESIKLKNGMQAPITVLLQPQQLNAPIQVDIRVGDVFNLRLEYDGPYTIQVIPQDQPDSGYHLGDHDLKSIAKSLGEHPLELEGDFGLYLNRENGVLFQIRDRVRFDAVVAGQQWPLRFVASRVNYRDSAPKGDQVEGEFQPVGLSAIVVATIPSNARLTIDGAPTTSTGSVRHFVTPELDPRRKNIYTMTAEWTKDGKPCKATREVQVVPGQICRTFFEMIIKNPPPLQVLALRPIILVPVPTKRD